MCTYWNFLCIKNNKVLSYLGMWIKLEITISSKFNQLQNDKYHVFHLWFLDFKDT